MSDFLDLQGAKDLNTDAIHLSAVANSVDPATGAPIDTHVNRAGGTDYTLKGFWNELGPVVMPWTSVAGGTLTQPNQAFLHPADGNYYSWCGDLSHVVAPGTDPTAVGSGYVPRTDVVLRGDLSEPGANGVVSGCIQFNSVSEMIAADWLTIGTIVKTLRRNTANWYGGGNWLITSVSGADGFAKVAIAGSSLMAIAIPVGGVITAEQCGVVDGDASTVAATQSWVDRCAEVGCTGTVETVSVVPTSGLLVSSGTDIDLADAELFLVAGSNKPIISNKNKSFTTKVDSYIKIKATRPLNCNEANQTSNVTPSGELLSGVCFVGVENMVIDFDLKSPRRYAWWFINCKGVSSTRKINAYHTHASGAPNKDGFHINGNCEDFNIPWIHVDSGYDDTLGINATDVDHGGLFTSASVSGPIKNINIGKHTNSNSYNGIRILAASNNIDSVNIGSTDLNVSRYPLNVDNYGLGLGGNIRSVHIGELKYTCIDGDTTDARQVWLNGENLFSSDIKIDRVIREQQSTATASLPTIQARLGQNADFVIGDVIEYSCSNTQKVHAELTGVSRRFHVGKVQSTVGVVDQTAVVTPFTIKWFNPRSNDHLCYDIHLGDVDVYRMDYHAKLEYATISNLQIGFSGWRGGSNPSGSVGLSYSNVECVTFNAPPRLGAAAIDTANMIVHIANNPADNNAVWQVMPYSIMSSGVRPTFPSVRQFNYNFTGDKLEFFNGAAWRTVQTV